MLGDKENLHYVVGLTGEKYSIILDVDDFNKIKDLTRLKLGLTINGIKILRDENGVFQKSIDKFNKDRIENLVEVEKIKEDFDGKDVIEYFKKIIDVLRKYNIDSQGFFEYMKLIVEDKEIEVEKVWKEVKGEIEKRYSGCSIFEYDGKTYLIDSVEQELNEVDIEKLDKKIFIFNPEENEYSYYGG